MLSDYDKTGLILLAIIIAVVVAGFVTYESIDNRIEGHTNYHLFHGDTDILDWYSYSAKDKTHARIDRQDREINTLIDRMEDFEEAYYYDTVSAEQTMWVRALNGTDDTLRVGSIVCINGAVGAVPSVALASPDSVGSDDILGYITKDLPPNFVGEILVDPPSKGISLGSHPCHNPACNSVREVMP